jgi:hypothetical protein
MSCFIVLWCVVATGTIAPCAHQPDPSSPSPLLGGGPLQDVRKPLEQVFQFTFAGPHLKLDRQRWEQAAQGAPKAEQVRANLPAANRLGPESPIEVLFRQIQAAAGASGGGMSISGPERIRDLRFSGASLNGNLHIHGDIVRLILEEAQPPRRTLEFSDDGQGSFRLEVLHPDGEMVLLHQMRQGRFAAFALVSGQLFAGQGESFPAFCRQHRAGLNAQILPALEQFGVAPILSPHTPRVRKAVLALLARSPETLAEGQRLLADLDSEKFAVREMSSQVLSDRFELYRDLIEAKLGDKEISLEVRNRLQKILAQQVESPKVHQTVTALNLLQDVRYLASLLDHAAPEDLPGLLRQLEKATGQKLGPDPATWREWVKKNVK